MREAQIVILMIDTTNGITDQDMKVIHLIQEHGCALILAVNKWDLIADVTQENYLRFIDDRLRMKRYFDVIFMSVKDDRNVLNVFDRIRNIRQFMDRKVSTSVVNQLLRTAVERTQPPVLKGKRAKFYYATQTKIFPPEFLLFVNDKKRILKSYQHYLENHFQDRLGYFGFKVKISYKDRPREKWAFNESRGKTSSSRSSASRSSTESHASTDSRASRGPKFASRFSGSPAPKSPKSASRFPGAPASKRPKAASPRKKFKKPAGRNKR